MRSISFSAVVNDGQRGEPKKVHLEQAQLLDRFHVIGGDDFVVLAAADRHQFGERLGRDHHAGGMHARSAHQPFELARGVDQFLYLGLCCRRPPAAAASPSAPWSMVTPMVAGTILAMRSTSP